MKKALNERLHTIHLIHFRSNFLASLTSWYDCRNLQNQVDLMFLFIHGVQFPEESVTCSFKLSLAFKLIFSWVPVEQQLEKEKSSKKKGYNLSTVCLPGPLKKTPSLLLFFLHLANMRSGSRVENLLV